MILFQYGNKAYIFTFKQKQMKMKNLLIVSAVALLALSSCNKDEKEDDVQPDVENEIITTVQFEITDSLANEVKTYKWENLNGYGQGSTFTVDTIKLKAITTYHGKLLLLNKTNPLKIDTISNEVLELKNEHQFFYENNETLSLTSSYVSNDVDDHGVPVGIRPKMITGNMSSGNLTITLKHQPGVKPKSGNGNKNLGSTDVMVTFPVIIK